MPDFFPNVSLSGNLTVEEGKVFKQRFCLIDGEAKKMFIYTSDPRIQPNKADVLGTIDLRMVSMAKATSQSGGKQKYENCFSITSLGDEYVFKANNSDEMQTWIETINNECRITVIRHSASISTKESEEGGYSMAVVAGVLHKTLVDVPSLEDESLSSETDTDDEQLQEFAGAARSGKIIKSGYAVKQGFIFKNWKKRYFIVDDAGVSYYSNDQAEKPIRTIPISRIIEARPSIGIHLDRANLLEIVTKDRVFYLQVGNKDEEKSWISAINTYVAKMKESMKNAEVQTTATLERNSGLHVGQAVRENSQSTASQTTDFLRKKPSVKNPLPNRTVQSYSTYL